LLEINLKIAYLTTKLGFVDISLLYSDLLYSFGILNNDVESDKVFNYKKAMYRCLKLYPSFYILNYSKLSDKTKNIQNGDHFRGWG
jgi:hypothetical protein